jgi:hypothetical protein
MARTAEQTRERTRKGKDERARLVGAETAHLPNSDFISLHVALQQICEVYMNTSLSIENAQALRYAAAIIEAYRRQHGVPAS